jgi:hypothetical protein
MENLCSSEYAQVSDVESPTSTSDNEDEDENDDDGDEAEENLQGTEADDDIEEFSGLGSEGMMKVKSQMDSTRVFGKWEKHTRGMASKIMLGMGYREGMGLGRSGQGIVVPIQARVLPKGQSLDFIGKDENSQTQGEKKKKSSRGGKRKRDKKFAEAARLARLRSEEEGSVDVFGFINNQLAGQRREEDSWEGVRLSGGKADSNQKQGKEKAQHNGDGRRSLMAQADGVAELKNRVEKLEEMALRNRKDKAVHEAVSRKLDAARRELRAAEANHASASFAVHSEEKEKKWLRF